MASFTRWSLNDYPVQVRIRPDGLLVAGSPKGSTWKHPFILDTEVLATVPLTASYAVERLSAGGVLKNMFLRLFGMAEA